MTSATADAIGARDAPREHAGLRHPSEDRRWRQVDVRIRRLGARPDGLIEVLHTLQQLFGYLDEDALSYVSEALGVPPSQVMGVATFYSFFVLKPQGEHTCIVCTGTACYLNGAKAILRTLRDSLAVEVGGTTPDGRLSLLGARCLGACSQAPVVVLDGEMHGKVRPEEISGLVASHA